MSFDEPGRWRVIQSAFCFVLFFSIWLQRVLTQTSLFLHYFNFNTRPATSNEHLQQPPNPPTPTPAKTLPSCPYRLFFLLPATQTPSSPESQSSLLIRPRIFPKNMKDSPPRPQATDHPPQATAHRPPSSYPSTHPAHGPASSPRAETQNHQQDKDPFFHRPQHHRRRPETTAASLGSDRTRPDQTRPDQTKGTLPIVHLLEGSSLPLLARIPSPGRPAVPWGQSSGHT